MPYPFGPFFPPAHANGGSGETRSPGCVVSEIDFEHAMWTMPGARQKNGKPHHVHLSAPAFAILRDLADTRRHHGPCLHDYGRHTDFRLL